MGARWLWVPARQRTVAGSAVLIFVAVWQRLTDRARRVVYYAQEEAKGHGENSVMTEHLLLGLLHEPLSTGMRALLELGIEPEGLREEIERQIVKQYPRPTPELTLNPMGKSAIFLAYREAQRLGHRHIGTEHLILGLVREEDGLAGRLLREQGVELARLRVVVEGLSPAGVSRPTSPYGLAGRLHSWFGSAKARLTGRGVSRSPEE